MSARLPLYIDPWRLVHQGSQLDGRLPLAPMDRLGSTILNSAEYVSVSLEFSNQGDFSVVEGTISGKLELLCQRCLQPVTLAVDKTVRLALVRGDLEAKRLSDDLEPLMVAGGTELSLSELVEDELLLLLPEVATHPAGECTLIFNPAEDQTPSQEIVEQQKPQPFAVLSEFKV